MVQSNVLDKTLSDELSMTRGSNEQNKLAEINSPIGRNENDFVSEMAMKNIKDFKGRSRANIVPRVAKRIDKEERKNKDLQSTISSI